MNKLWEIIKFLWPEFLILAIIILILVFKAQWVAVVGEPFKTNKDIWLWLPVIPLVFVGVNFRMANNILKPRDTGSNKDLYTWPSYWKLKYRVIASLVLCGLCVLGSFIIWVFTAKMSEATIGTVYLTSVSIGLEVTFSQLLAQYKIREIMDN